MKVECPLCHNQQRTAKAELMGGICETCGDIVEFGYLSFPAYRLEEKEPVVGEPRTHMEAHGVRRKMAVG